MNRLASVLVWAVAGAVVLGGGAFGYLMFTGPKGDPSVYGTSLLAGLGAGAMGVVLGALYGAFKRA